MVCLSRKKIIHFLVGKIKIIIWPAYLSPTRQKRGAVLVQGHHGSPSITQGKDPTNQF